MFAGLAIQVEKPFRVGHWIMVGPFEGLVSEVTWRATKIRTKAATSSPCRMRSSRKRQSSTTPSPRRRRELEVDVGVSYAVRRPGEAALVEAVGNAPLALPEPPADSADRRLRASAVILSGAASG